MFFNAKIVLLSWATASISNGNFVGLWRHKQQITQNWVHCTAVDIVTIRNKKSCSNNTIF